MYWVKKMDNCVTIQKFEDDDIALQSKHTFNAKTPHDVLSDCFVCPTVPHVHLEKLQPFFRMKALQK